MAIIQLLVHRLQKNVMQETHNTKLALPTNQRSPLGKSIVLQTSHARVPNIYSVVQTFQVTTGWTQMLLSTSLSASLVVCVCSSDCAKPCIVTAHTMCPQCPPQTLAGNITTTFNSKSMACMFRLVRISCFLGSIYSPRICRIVFQNAA